MQVLELILVNKEYLASLGHSSLLQASFQAIKKYYIVKENRKERS